MAGSRNRIPGTLNRQTGSFGQGSLGRQERHSGVSPEIESLSLDLVQLAFDLAGIVDPTPVSDGASAIIALARGHWLDAVISGISMVPYVGDLAKSGKLPGYARSIQRGVKLAEGSADYSKRLLEPMKNLGVALDLLPANVNKYVDEIRNSVDSFLLKHAAKKISTELPDISNLFIYKTYNQGTLVVKEARGRLGVPGKVRSFRKSAPGAEKYARSKVSSGTGDHAGHLIGDQFGAMPGKIRKGGLGADNLSLQNAKMNSNGSWYQLEKQWAEKMKKGYGYEVNVKDFYRKGEIRPHKRKISGVEIAPDGTRTNINVEGEMGEVIYGNFETAASRAAKGMDAVQDAPGKLIKGPWN